MATLFHRHRRNSDDDELFAEIMAFNEMDNYQPFSFDEAMENANPINAAEAEAMNPPELGWSWTKILAMAMAIFGVVIVICIVANVAVPTLLRWLGVGGIVIGIFALLAQVPKSWLDQPGDKE